MSQNTEESFFLYFVGTVLLFVVSEFFSYLKTIGFISYLSIAICLSFIGLRFIEQKRNGYIIGESDENIIIIFFSSVIIGNIFFKLFNSLLALSQPIVVSIIIFAILYILIEKLIPGQQTIIQNVKKKSEKDSNIYTKSLEALLMNKKTFIIIFPIFLLSFVLSIIGLIGKSLINVIFSLNRLDRETQMVLFEIISVFIIYFYLILDSFFPTSKLFLFISTLIFYEFLFFFGSLLYSQKVSGVLFSNSTKIRKELFFLLLNLTPLIIHIQTNLISIKSFVFILAIHIYFSIGLIFLLGKISKIREEDNSLDKKD